MRNAVAAGVLGGVLALTGLAAGGSGAAAPGGSGVRSTASVAHVPPGSTDVGPVAGSQPLSVDVALRPRDPAALSAFVSAVSTPGSPSNKQSVRGGCPRRASEPDRPQQLPGLAWSRKWG